MTICSFLCSVDDVPIRVMRRSPALTKQPCRGMSWRVAKDVGGPPGNLEKPGLMRPPGT